IVPTDEPICSVVSMYASDLPVGKKLYAAPPNAPVGVSSIERDWLQYAIDHIRDDNEPEDATCADVLEALLNRVESAPVGAEELVSRAISQGKRLQWSAVMDTLERLRGTLALAAQQPPAEAQA